MMPQDVGDTLHPTDVPEPSLEGHGYYENGPGEEEFAESNSAKYDLGVF